MVGNTESDYLLFIEGKAIAVVEAKREENRLVRLLFLMKMESCILRQQVC